MLYMKINVPNNKLEKITIIGAVIIVIFIIGIIIAIVANDMGGKSKKDDTQPTATASTSNNVDGEYISDVTGKSREEAEAYLKQLGFTNISISNPLRIFMAIFTITK